MQQKASLGTSSTATDTLLSAESFAKKTCKQSVVFAIGATVSGDKGVNMPRNLIDDQLAKTLAYLDSDDGRADWAANERRGYGYRACLLAAIMEATGCRKVESLQAIERGVIVSWVRGRCA
jgi:hypothetical protein